MITTFPERLPQDLDGFHKTACERYFRSSLHSFIRTKLYRYGHDLGWWNSPQGFIDRFGLGRSAGDRFFKSSDASKGLVSIEKMESIARSFGFTELDWSDDRSKRRFLMRDVFDGCPKLATDYRFDPRTLTERQLDEIDELIEVYGDIGDDDVMPTASSDRKWIAERIEEHKNPPDVIYGAGVWLHLRRNFDLRPKLHRIARILGDTGFINHVELLTTVQLAAIDAFRIAKKEKTGFRRNRQEAIKDFSNKHFNRRFMALLLNRVEMIHKIGTIPVMLDNLGLDPIDLVCEPIGRLILKSPALRPVALKLLRYNEISSKYS